MAVSVYVLRRRRKGVARVSESYRFENETPVIIAPRPIDESGEREIDRRFDALHDRAKQRNHQINSTYREMERLRVGARNDEV